MSSQPPDAPRIEFPCDYPIKVLGRQSAGFRELVVEVMSRHAGAIDANKITERPSGKGTFVSITVVITATGKDQLDAIHRDLMATGRVQMVL